MSEKKRLRFLKKIVLYNIVMLTLVTLAVLAVAWKTFEITSGTVTALVGAWSIELILNAFIKDGETKAETKKSNNTEGSI